MDHKESVQEGRAAYCPASLEHMNLAVKTTALLCLVILVVFTSMCWLPVSFTDVETQQLFVLIVSVLSLSLCFRDTAARICH